MFVATETFVDPTDGDLIEAGRTFVSPRADVFRMFPSRFKRASRMARSAIGSPDGLERRGDVTHLLGDEVAISNDHSRYRRRAAATVERPYWQILEPREPEAWRLRR